MKSLSEATMEGRMKEAAQKGWQAEKPGAYPLAALYIYIIIYISYIILQLSDGSVIAGNN